MRIGKGQAYGKRGGQRWVGAAVVDVGEVRQPIRNFHELVDLLEADEGDKLRIGIESGRITVVMVRYARHGLEAALGLIAENRNVDRLRAANAAHAGESTRRLRAGLDSELLASSKVALVGVGAVGSLLAEMLIRSGVGTLTLMDGGVVRPGNCIRHLARPTDVGRSKSEAVRDRIIDTGVVSKKEARHRLIVETRPLTSATATEQLFKVHDLVIDATGDGPATALVCTGSRILDEPSVTVCLQRGGTVARVDRFPLRNGESHAEALQPGGPDVVLREGGCGDPVSPTPPWACAAAAARAAGMVVDELSGRNLYPPTVIDVLIGRPDGPPIPAGPQ